MKNVEEVKNILNDYLEFGIITNENFKEIVTEVFGEFSSDKHLEFDKLCNYSFVTTINNIEFCDNVLTNSKNEVLYFVNKDKGKYLFNYNKIVVNDMYGFSSIDFDYQYLYPNIINITNVYQ